MIRQPCLVCEDETATGSPRYSSRKVIEAGGRKAFVCEECASRTSPERRRELSRAETARLNESAAVFGAWWNGGPGGGS
jgi:protein-arginine kinase activator protein McsA